MMGIAVEGRVEGWVAAGDKLCRPADRLVQAVRPVQGWHRALPSTAQYPIPSYQFGWCLMGVCERAVTGWHPLSPLFYCKGKTLFGLLVNASCLNTVISKKVVETLSSSRCVFLAELQARRGRQSRLKLLCVCLWVCFERAASYLLGHHPALVWATVFSRGHRSRLLLPLQQQRFRQYRFIRPVKLLMLGSSRMIQ